MTVKELYEYWESHQAEFPVKFDIRSDALAVIPVNRLGGVCLDNESIALVDTEFADGWVELEFCGFSLRKKCEELGYNYDLDNPGDFLRAVVDCVYIELIATKVRIGKYISCIDGEE